MKDGSKAKAEISARVADMEKVLAEAKARAAKESTEVKIRHRHHFASKLQRMSTVVTVTSKSAAKVGAAIRFDS